MITITTTTISTRVSPCHRPLKAQLAGELAVAADEDERKAIKAEYEARERAFEHELDHTPRELSMALTINYNFLSK